MTRGTPKRTVRADLLSKLHTGNHGATEAVFCPTCDAQLQVRALRMKKNALVWIGCEDCDNGTMFQARDRNPLKDDIHIAPHFARQPKTKE